MNAEFTCTTFLPNSVLGALYIVVGKIDTIPDFMEVVYLVRKEFKNWQTSKYVFNHVVIFFIVCHHCTMDSPKLKVFICNSTS